MFMLYNGVLREWPEILQRNNQYVTTIHCLNSMVLKLSQLSKATKVYRGISGGILPDSFVYESFDKWRGGVHVLWQTAVLGVQSAPCGSGFSAA